MVAPRPADLSATTMVAGFAEGTLSPVDVLDDVQSRIEVLEPHVQALYAPDPVAARDAAEASLLRWREGTPAGPIDGVPITLKENIPTRGTPVPSGTAATDLVPAAADGPPAARVREAGAVILGKTTMPDWGMLSSGLSSFHPLARNPWNLDWNPGGSSAGACAAGAAGYGPLHVGSDIGGSLRLPAAWTALVSLKPSWGLAPVAPPYWGRVVGPITRTVADCALLLDVLAQPDPEDRDHTSLPPVPARVAPVPDFDPAGLRVGLQLDAGAGMEVAPQVAAAVRAAAEVFVRAGADVVEVAPFMTPDSLADLDLFWRVRGWEVFRRLSPARQDAVLPYIAEWCRGGADVAGHEVMRCANQQLEVGRATVAATRPYDLVISPVSPNVAFPAHWPGPANDVTRAMHHIAFTVPYNFSHQPALSINAGFTDDGGPIGMQVAGPRFGDRDVLAAAAWWEGHRPVSATPTWPAPGVADLDPDTRRVGKGLAT